MLVYRVEDKDGLGPYASGSTALFWGCSGYHPTPDEEGFPEVESYHYFGFDSLFQLCNWFDKNIRKSLRAAGFKINIYDCPDTLLVSSSYQVMFQRDMSRLCKTMELR